MNCLIWVLGTQISLNPQVTSLFLVYLFFCLLFIYCLFMYLCLLCMRVKPSRGQQVVSIISAYFFEAGSLPKPMIHIF